jgi:hypothetical protein
MKTTRRWTAGVVAFGWLASGCSTASSGGGEQPPLADASPGKRADASGHDSGSHVHTTADATADRAHFEAGTGPRDARTVHDAHVATDAAPSGIKFHPGLWREDATNIYGYPGAQITTSANASETASDPAYVVGLMQGISLGSITQTQGVYDLSYLDSLYTTLSAGGKRLALRMMWSQIGYSNPGGFNVSAFPAYMNDASGANVYGGMLELDFGTSFGGYVLDVERAAVMNAFIDAVKAVCAHFDDGAHPYFEGLSFEETAWNVPSANSGAGWDESAFLTQYLALITAAREACPHSLLSYRANWGTNAQMESVAAAELATASGDGTTDLDTTYPNNMDAVMNGSVGGTSYLASSLTTPNKLVQAPFSETAGLGGNPNTFTATQLIQFAQAKQANYFFPGRYTGDGWTDATWPEIMTAYVAAGSTLNMVCPSSYPSCITN